MRSIWMNCNLTYAFVISSAAVVGVVIRLCLARAFGPGGIGILSNDSALFLDLAANALGSFLAGLYVPFKDAAIELSPSLHLAVMTGFLGSLTTFASWNLQATSLMVAGRWVDGFLSLVIGTELAMASFAIGQDASVFIVSMSSWCRLMEKTSEDEQGSGIAHQATGQCPDLPPEPTDDPSRHQLNETGQLDRSGQEGTPKSPDKAVPPCSAWLSRGMLCTQIQKLLLPAVAVLLLVLIVLAVVGLVMDDNWSRRTIYLSAIFGPLGALLRWQLSERLNQRLRGFPLGTFLANMIAVTLDSSVRAATVKRSLSYAESAVAESSISGLGGALSTVSSWVVELSMFRSRGGPGLRSCYMYVFISLAVAQVIGIVIYGSTEWVEKG